MDEAQTLADYLLVHYWDGEVPCVESPHVGAGVFSRSDLVTDLPARPKEIFDGATPSSHAVACRCLARLALCRGDNEMLCVAQRLVELGATLLATHPSAVPDLVEAAGFALEGIEVVIPGRPNKLSEHLRLSPMVRTVLITGDGPTPLLLHRSAPDSRTCAAEERAFFRLVHSATWTTTSNGAWPVTFFHRDPSVRAIKRLVQRMPQREDVNLTPGSTVYGLVLGSTNESTTVVDLASQAIVRWRIPWPEDFAADLAVFDVVEGQLAMDIERNDLAQPEAVTLVDLPRRLGSYRGRRVRRWLEKIASPADGHLFGFRGPSAPYWEFRGERPSVALIAADSGPQLLRRSDDGSTWVRFGWYGDDVWLLL